MFFPKTWKYLFFTCAAVFIVSFFHKNALPGPRSVLTSLYQSPVQTSVEKPVFHVKKGLLVYAVRPLFSYEIYGMVASCHRSDSWEDYYHKLAQDVMNIKDIALLWGQNLKNDVYQRCAFKSGSWTAYVEPRFGASYDSIAGFDNTCFSNNHLIAEDPQVRRLVMAMRRGDQVYLKGELVNYGRDNNPDERRTSTVRTDYGCEVIWVTQARILKRANALWHFLFPVSGVLCLAGLAGWIYSSNKEDALKMKKLNEERRDFP